MTKKIISERYEINEQLGAGGMGTVYRGLDTVTEADVAIKHLRPEIADDEQIARFKREGIALRDLNHPNIVKMWDAIEEDGNYYLILDYVVGGDLNELLKIGKLSPEKVVAMGIDIADALTRAHKLGIIHRDLKPANILIDDDGTLRLTDFGIAHVVSQDTVSNADSLVGTVDYMAPETIQGEDANPLMDIWAFGVMLFEMLTQTRPFARKNMTETWLAILHDPIPNLGELCADLPEELEDLIYRMLERDTHMRISSVRHIGAILEDIQQGRGTDSHIAKTSRFEGSADTYLMIKHDNLPEQLTEFVGRTAEIQEIERILPTTRLVTILAPGGMGKTRLSLEVARRNLNTYEDGVYFVELAELSDSTAIVPAVAEAVNCTLADAKGNEEKFLFDFLSNKSLLLVMDNYEHLMDGANFVGKLLKNCPSLTIIATSRQRLNQSGETLFHLSGMDFPDWETPEDAADYAAVKLFMGSARRTRPDFELSVDNLPYLARICRLVQGMPLGIVLSAAWLAVLDPQEIAEEIAQGIDFLEAEGGDLPERQRSIRAVFDYAWHMISEADRDTVMALSIFQAGFTREAAQVVADANIRQLMKLVNLSLLQRDNDSGRYHIHELLRQYIAEKLNNSGNKEAIRQQHAQYYGNKVSEISTDLMNGQVYALAFGHTEFENLKTAMIWDIEAGDGKVLSQLYGGIPHWIREVTRADEIQHLMRQAYHTFETRDIDDAIWGKILAGYGIVEGYVNHNFAVSAEMLDKGIALLERANQPVAVASFTVNRIHIERFKGDVNMAETYARQAYDLSKQLGHKSLLAQAASSLGFISTAMRNNPEEGKKWYLETLDLARAVDNKRIMALAHFNLSNIYYLEDNFSPARENVEEALRLCEITGHIQLRFHVGDILAKLYVLEGNSDSAEAILKENVMLAENSQRKDMILRAVSFLNLFYMYLGRYDDSLEILARRDKLVPPEQVNEAPRLENALPIALSQWGKGDHENPIAIFEKSVATLFNKVTATSYIYALFSMALVWSARGEYTRSLRMLGLLKARTNWSDVGDKHALVQQLENELKAQFSEQEYDEILQEGAKRDYRETVNALVAELTAK